MNMRKIIAVLAAVLMLCAIVPMNVFAAPGDVVVNKNFDDGKAFSNGSCENGYMVFNATTADWANVYFYANNIKSGNKYEITFDAKADKATNINVKINNNWSGDTFKWTTNVTTEWATYTTVINPDELANLTSTALLMFTSNSKAANGAIYHIDNVVVKEYAEPVTGDVIYNADFENNALNGWMNNAGGVSVVPTSELPVANAACGNYVFKKVQPAGEYSFCEDQQGFTVEPNTDYIVTVDVLPTSNNWPIQAFVSANTWITNQLGASEQVKCSNSKWTTLTFEFNSGDNTKLFASVKSIWENTTLYVDNFKIVEKVAEEPEAPVEDFDSGLCINGGFATGDNTGWTLHQSTAISTDAAHSGAYGANLKGNGGWGGMLYQNIAVEAGKTYEISMWMKANAQGANVQVKDGGTSGGNLASTWYNKTSWNQVTFSITPTTNVICINYCGGGTGVGEDVYVDDVAVFEVKTPSYDGYIYNGDFETRKTSPWENLWGSCPTVEVVKDGKDSDYALEIVSGQWKHVRQTNIAVQPNTNYVVTAWAKNAKAMSLLVKDGGDSKDLKNIGVNAGDEWTEFTGTFNSGDYTSIIFSLMGGAAEAYGIFDNISIAVAHTHNYVGTVTKEATCGEDGEMTYACTCGEGTYTEPIPATGLHEYFYPCDTICMNCFEETRPEATHSIIAVDAKDSTCTEMGNIAYWYCSDCGSAWLDADCTMNTNMMAVKLPLAEHEYFYDCDTFCMNCFEETNPEAAHSMIHVEAKAATCFEDGNIEYWYCEDCGYAWLDAEGTLNTNMMAVVLPVSHNVIHVEAKDPTCTELGNIEYWYCEDCGSAWLDELCRLNTNMMAVKLPMVDHSYDNDYDVDCNVCGGIRTVEMPIASNGTSVSEDVSGLAARFTINVDGMAFKEGTKTVADYSNATVDGYKLIGMGAVASNGVTTVEIPAKYLFELDAENGTASFATRIINIPTDKYDVEITFQSYFDVEIDGETVRIFGETVTASYNAVLNR